MSVFETLAGQILAPALNQTFGVGVKITPKNGAPVTVPATVIYGSLGTRGTDRAGRLEYEHVVLIAKSQYPGGEPNKGGDRIEVPLHRGSGKTITKDVSAILGGDGGMWRLGLG